MNEAAVTTNLRLHNTLSDEIEPLEPCEPGRVGIYVCGPTVYDYAHIGHMRSALTYDVAVRHLRESGFEVRYVRNITDIDDKMVARAAERGELRSALAKRFEEAYREDTARLSMLEPDIEPRVSEHLPQIRALIERLIERGAAYVADGDVYFSVEAFPEYGKLSHRKAGDIAAGASGRTNEAEQRRKRHPADFALWKGTGPQDQLGETCWESPWGKGRPGWHIECSTMSMEYLGESFDLHGGGLDLVFPHHENEIAQSEAATGKRFCRLWVHHGFIEVNKEKMSKSLGNFFTARECFRFVEPEALRYFALSVHYRAPLNLDWEIDDAGQVLGFPQIEEAERRVEYIYNTHARLAAIPEKRIRESDEVPDELASFAPRLRDALDADLNFPVALSVVAEFLKAVNELAEKTKSKKGHIGRAALEAARAGLSLLGRVLGLGTDDPGAFLERVRARRARRLGLSEASIGAAIEERNAARKARDFAAADALRDRLAAQGVELMDGPDGTSWRIP